MQVQQIIAKRFPLLWSGHEKHDSFAGVIFVCVWLLSSSQLREITFRLFNALSPSLTFIGDGLRVLNNRWLSPLLWNTSRLMLVFRAPAGGIFIRRTGILSGRSYLDIYRTSNRCLFFRK